MKVVLLDRDGTVIIEPPDTHTPMPGSIELQPDALPALAKLAKAGFRAIFITNQNIIGNKPALTMEDYDATADETLELIKPSGIKVLKTYLCPHTIDFGCECRKPRPKMLLEAIKDFNLDPAETYMVGDRVTDVEAGKNARMKTILVKTGNFPTDGAEPTYEADDLNQAVDYIIETP